MDRTDLKSLTLEELKSETERLGEPKFRAAQIYDWMHKKGAASVDEMSNISLTLREKLKAEYAYSSLKCVRLQESGEDDTKKFLFELSDGNLIESVWMKYHHGN